MTSSKNSLIRGVSRSVLVAVTSGAAEFSKSFVFLMSYGGALPLRNLEGLFPNTSCALCAPILPWCSHVGGQKCDTMRLALLSKITF